MSIKANQILTVGSLTLLDRLQTSGPGAVNVPREKITELGNVQAVGYVSDIPDTTWTAESLDASCEFECVLTRRDFSTVVAGTAIKFTEAKPLDVISPFKFGAASATPYDVQGAVGIPYLVLESVGYNFGISSNASQTFSLKGDSVYYAKKSMMVEETVGTNAANQIVSFAQLAAPYDDAGTTKYAISVTLAETGVRLSYGTDYTENVTGAGTNKTVTITVVAAVPTTDKIRVMYASPATTNYPQVSHAVASATQPAALRGRNIEVLVNGTSLSNRWTSVQSVQVDWKVSLDRDLELSNANVVAQDYDVPDVTGQIEIKPRDYNDLYTKLRTILNVTDGYTIGALSSIPMTLDIRLNNPTTGTPLKTLHVPDARFTLPGFSGRVGQKATMQISFQSETGSLDVVAKQ